MDEAKILDLDAAKALAKKLIDDERIEEAGRLLRHVANLDWVLRSFTPGGSPQPIEDPL